MIFRDNRWWYPVDNGENTMPWIEPLPGETMMDTLRRFQSQRPSTPEDEHRDRLLAVIQQTPFQNYNRNALFVIVSHLVEMGLLPIGAQD